MRGLRYLLRDILFSILITVFIVCGAHWLAFHTGDTGYAQLGLSIMLAPLMLVATMSSIGLAVRFFIDGYFNRFITILCLTFLTGFNWCEIVTEKISSLNSYFDSGLAPYAVMALGSFLAIGIGKIIVGLRSRHRPLGRNRGS